MKNSFAGMVRLLLVGLFALCIPGLLIIDGIHARRYTDLERQVEEREKKQQRLIEENKKQIADTGLLS